MTTTRTRGSENVVNIYHNNFRKNKATVTIFFNNSTYWSDPICTCMYGCCKCIGRLQFGCSVPRDWYSMYIRMHTMYMEYAHTHTGIHVHVHAGLSFCIEPSRVCSPTPTTPPPPTTTTTTNLIEIHEVLLIHVHRRWLFGSTSFKQLCFGSTSHTLPLGLPRRSIRPAIPSLFPPLPPPPPKQIFGPDKTLTCTRTCIIIVSTYISLLFFTVVKSLQVTKHLNLLCQHSILEKCAITAYMYMCKFIIHV